jgi:hypothetical protein
MFSAKNFFFELVTLSAGSFVFLPVFFPAGDSFFLFS